MSRLKCEARPPLDRVEQDEFNWFAEIASIYTPHHVARAMNRLTRGVNWYGCSKSTMATAWACRNRNRSPYGMHGACPTRTQFMEALKGKW